MLAAEETDSYTKEETKSSKFINLTHAASMTKHPSPSPFSGGPPTGSAAHSRLQGASSSSLLPRQFSSSQVSEGVSGLPPSNSRADHDGCEASGASWAGSPPSSSWLAKAASCSQPQPSMPAAPSLPVPPAADEQVSRSVRPCHFRSDWQTICSSPLNAVEKALVGTNCSGTMLHGSLHSFLPHRLCVYSAGMA